jgi:hypothetical protein
VGGEEEGQREAAASPFFGHSLKGPRATKLNEKGFEDKDLATDYSRAGYE